MESIRYIEPVELGAGVHGSVKKHYDTKLGIHVAIKVAKKTRISLNEANILTKLHREMKTCDYIPTFYKAGPVGKSEVAIVMEYAPGKALSTYNLSEDRKTIFSIFKCVAKALHSIHSLEIIHRDVKPANIVVNLNPLSVKLIDWGYACHVSDKTWTKHLLGSPFYSAQELYYRVPYVDMANDVWSFGVSLFVMLMNRYPIDVEDGEDLFSRFINILLLNQVDYTDVPKLDKIIYESIFIHYTFRITASELIDDMTIMEKASTVSPE